MCSFFSPSLENIQLITRFERSRLQVNNVIIWKTRNVCSDEAIESKKMQMKKKINFSITLPLFRHEGRRVLGFLIVFEASAHASLVSLAAIAKLDLDFGGV